MSLLNAIPGPATALRIADHSPEARALVVLGLASTAIGGAWVLELFFGYAPCKLCLLQRWPYYMGVPLALLAWVITGPLRTPRAARPAFAALAMIFMVSVALGVHHAGVEWGWWAGPSDCGGAVRTGPASAENLLAAMNATRIVSCTDATVKFLGFSLAGWNALVSFVIAMVAIRGWRRPAPPRPV
jgi:disulfide bond formation protein DsbB